ncbi:MAG: FAD-binding protein [Lysobacteraceae bacterium]|nr:MAG: FAD-binding protein [Xanthomonadaceae bacterium]
MNINYTYLLYFVPAAIGIAFYLRRRHRIETEHTRSFYESLESGLTEPPSLHPVIDNALCIGSGCCVRACPEHALGIIAGKAVLTNPSACIGHGACHAACPVDAISLVFGTERRGVDIPDVNPDFESNVTGVFIAGELGGMGLIRKAAEQGRQAMEAIAGHKDGHADHDVIIVGSGPAGISAGLSAMEKRLRYVLLEQESSLGGAVFHYPRNKVAMTSPVDLALIGKMHFKEVSKEKLLEFWQNVVNQTRLKIHYSERMESVHRDGDAFVVVTTKARYRTRTVLLAIGRRGSPRRLEVPGEDLPKVTYRVGDPARFAGQRVLIVGGGDSAVEAAIACADYARSVHLSYRSEVFSRVKVKNREALEQLRVAGRVIVLMPSIIRQISPTGVMLEVGGEPQELANDSMVISIGGTLPTELLKSIGIRFETRHGEKKQKKRGAGT